MLWISFLCWLWRFSFCFWLSNSLFIMCLSIDIFEFILLEIHIPYISVFIPFFFKCGKFLAIVSSNKLSAHLSLSFLSGIPNCMYYNGVFYNFLKFYSFFLNLLYFCSSDLIISNDLFSNLLIPLLEFAVEPLQRIFQFNYCFFQFQYFCLVLSLWFLFFCWDFHLVNIFLISYSYMSFSSLNIFKIVVLKSLQAWRLSLVSVNFFCFYD